MFLRTFGAVGLVTGATIFFGALVVRCSLPDWPQTTRFCDVVLSVSAGVTILSELICLIAP